jgi:isopentenyl-diphosphate delta-isomerase
MSSVKEVAVPDMSPESTRDRKAEHITLALDDRMQHEARFFDAYRFVHNALPEIDRSEIDMSVEFLGRELSAPLLVSCMTGGTEEATQINRNLAAAAQEHRIALGVGSQRKAIEEPALAASFQVRDLAPSIPLLANLGAVQLNYGYGLDECRRAVEMIGADALVLHLNPLQEAIQPEGQCDFSGLLSKIGEIVRGLDVPVIVKEIGCGLGQETGRALKDVGVEILDSSGMGGTSWSRIEGRRAEDRPLGDLFADWGVPTPESIVQLAGIEGLTVIGSGGIRNGVEVAKAIGLGADLVGLAQPFLEPATRSADETATAIERIVVELEIAMFCVGARTVGDLQLVELVHG